MREFPTPGKSEYDFHFYLFHSLISVNSFNNPNAEAGIPLGGLHSRCGRATGAVLERMELGTHCYLSCFRPQICLGIHIPVPSSSSSGLERKFSVVQ